MEYKGYMIVGDNTYGLKLIKRSGKGAIAAVLQGMFTSSTEAQIAIDTVVSEKGDKNAEASNTD